MNSSQAPSLELASRTIALKEEIKAKVIAKLEESIAIQEGIDLENIDDEQLLAVYYHWIRFNLPDKKTDKIQSCIGIVGFIIGVLSTFGAYRPLGTDFGKLVSDQLSAGDAEILLEIFFGTTAFAPIAALIGLPTYSEFKNYAAYFLKHPTVPARSDYKYAKLATTALADFISLFSGIPFYNLLAEAFAGVPVLDVAAPLFGLIASYCASSSVTNSLINYYFPKEKQPSIDALRVKLKEQIKLAKQMVNDLDWHKLEIFSMSLAENAVNPPNNTIHNLLLDIFEKLPMQYYSQPHPDDSTHNLHATHPIFENCAKIVGFIMGGISTYVYYDLAIDTMNTWITDSSQTSTNLKIFSAVLAIIINTLFDAKYGKDGALNLYQGILDGKLLHANFVFAHLISAVSSTPSLYLAIIESDNSAEILLILITFIGASLGRSVAFEGLLNEIAAYFAKNSPEKMRKKILNLFDKIEQSIDKLPTETIIALHNKYLLNTNTSTHSPQFFQPKQKTKHNDTVLAETDEKRLAM